MENETMSTLKLGSKLAVLPWDDNSKVYIEVDGECFAVENVKQDESNGDIYLVATPNE